MYFEAISIGYGVPQQPFEATVHSVFESTINLQPTKGNELLTVVSSKGGDLPQGIRVDIPVNFSFENILVGESASCRRNSLRIGLLAIELRRAYYWKCNLPALKVDLANPDVVAAWKSAWQALNQRQVRLNADIIAHNLFYPDDKTRLGLAGRVGEAMRRLINATVRNDILAASSVHGLIGLGTGLTPAGDDLLVGYLGGLWSTVRNDSERLQFASDLGKTISQHSHLTNDISRTYLHYAAQGQISSHLAHLAEAISIGENSDRLLDIVETAMQVGHTSGMDAVTGLLVGLAAREGNILYL